MLQVVHLTVLLCGRGVDAGGRTVQVRLHLQREGADAHEEV